MSLHKPNSPEWWGDFFTYEPAVQTEFVHEYLESHLGVSRDWWDTTSVHFSYNEQEEGAPYTHPEKLSVAQFAGLLAVMEFEIVDFKQAVLVRTGDIFNRTLCGHVFLPQETEESFTELMTRSEALLREHHPWIWGWRQFCISRINESTIEMKGRRESPDKN